MIREISADILMKATIKIGWICWVQMKLDRVVRVKEMRWCVYVQRRGSGNVMKRSFGFEMVGRREQGRLIMICRRKVEKELEKKWVKEERCHQTVIKRCNTIYEIVRNMR